LAFKTASCLMLHLQFEARANTTLQKSVRKLCRQAMNSTEACAVSGNDTLRGKSGQGIAGLSKERFKGWPIEMEVLSIVVDDDFPQAACSLTPST